MVLYFKKSASFKLAKKTKNNKNQFGALDGLQSKLLFIFSLFEWDFGSSHLSTKFYLQPNSLLVIDFNLLS